MRSNSGMYRIKPAQEPNFFVWPSVHSEPAFQTVSFSKAGHPDAYEIGGTIRFVDLKNSGLQTGPLRGQRRNVATLCYP